MAKIYSSAKEVIIWLQSHGRSPPSSQRSECQCDAPCVTRKHSRTLLDRGEKPNQYISCSFVRDVLENTYWQRLWIIQEILLAQSRSVWLDHTIVSWHDLVQYRTEHLLRPIQLTWCLSQVALAQTETPRQPQGLPLHEVVRYCSASRARMLGTRSTAFWHSLWILNDPPLTTQRPFWRSLLMRPLSSCYRSSRRYFPLWLVPWD